LGAYFSWSVDKKTVLEYLMLGVFLSLILFLFFELLHSQGIFFGFISENFLAAELRRGLWIGSLLSLIVIIKNIEILMGGLKDSDKYLLIGGFITVYLVPSVVTVLILVCYASYLFNNKLSYLLGLTVIGMIVLNYTSGHFILGQQAKSLVVLLIVLSVIFAIKRVENHSKSMVIVSAFSIILTVYFVGSLKHGRLERSYLGLVSEGIFEKTNHDVAHNVLEENRGRGVIIYDSKARECIKGTSRLASANSKIQLPPHYLTHRVQPFYEQYLYFSSYDLSMPMFSRYEYALIVNKLKLLLGEGSVNNFLSQENYNKTDLYNFIEKQYSVVSLERLKAVRDRKGLRFYLTTNKREDLNNFHLCSGELFEVYDLSKI